MSFKRPLPIIEQLSTHTHTHTHTHFPPHFYFFGFSFYLIELIRLRLRSLWASFIFLICRNLQEKDHCIYFFKELVCCLNYIKTFLLSNIFLIHFSFASEIRPKFLLYIEWAQVSLFFICLISISWGTNLYALSYNARKGKHFPVRYGIYPTIKLGKINLTILYKAHLNISIFINFHLISTNSDTFIFSLN